MASQNILIVIPTRGRPERLDALLANFDRLALEAIALRVAVVDNNDAPLLRATCEAHAPSGYELLYRHEAVPGVSRARNTGWRLAAQGELVVFVDDDMVLPPDFARQVALVAAAHPDAQLIGGRVELADDRDLSVSISLKEGIERYRRPQKIFGFLHSNALIVRQPALRTLGGFDERLGPGNRTMAAEDSDLCYRADRAGMGIVYDDRLLSYHDHGRRGDDEERKILTAYLVGQGAFLAKHAPRDPALLKRVWWRLRDRSRREDRLESGTPWQAPYVKSLASGALAYILRR